MSFLIKKHFLVLFALLIAVFGAHSTAGAQEFNEVQAVIKPQLQLENSRKIRQLIQRIGKDRFDQKQKSRSSASFGADLDGEPDEEDVGEETPGRNFWIEGSVSRLEDSAPIRAYDGTQHSVSIGGDAAVTERLTLGIIGNYSESDVDNIFLPGNSTTEVISAGPYVAYFLTDTVVLTGSLLYSDTENGATSGGVVASYDSESWNANATLTTYVFAGNALFAPNVGISFSEERDEAYVDSAATFFAASTTRSSTLNFGVSASSSRVLSNGVTIDPSIGIEGEWTFDQSVDAPTSVVANTEEFDANVVFGIDFQWNESFSLEFSGNYAGLARTDYESLTGNVRVSFSF
ncbi:MAG: autotransporter outer membrane beta-barrel domain-containing protein [Pseudomonadota bacterium]